MKLVVIVGSGSGCGKTTVACRVLRAVPGLGAVKVSPREGPVRVEWGGGAQGKDTDLFACSGAEPVARIVGPRDRVASAWEGMRDRFGGCRGVVIEGSRGLDVPGDRYVIFVGADRWRESRPERNTELASEADIVIDSENPAEMDSLMASIQEFLSGNQVVAGR